MADADLAAADSASSPGPYDLLFLLDATLSMHDFIKGLNEARPNILRMAALTDAFERIGVMAYRDYSCRDITSWSGWCKSLDDAVDGWNMVAQKTVLDKAAHIVTQGNDDTPEASKMGLAYAYRKMRAEATTIIILYTDAPPHLKQVADRNGRAEQDALLKPDSYGGTGHHFADWTSGAKLMRDGDKKASVFCVLKTGNVASWSAYQYLSAMTGGTAFVLPRITPDIISFTTTTMLLTWMGTDERQMKNGVDDPRVPLEVPVYKLTKKISNATTENNPRLRNFMATKTSAVFNANSDTKRVSINDLGTVMTRRSPPVGDFAARYSRDDKYKDLVVAQLRGIFEQDVVAMSLNPVFGSLWRAVCNERGGRDRDVLAPIFGYHVGRIQNTHKKAQMKAWLDNSYDYSLAIEKEVGEVAAEHMYPMVFLDPTVEFAGREPGQRDENLRRLERSELLERYLENPVEAKVNWHPDKSQAAVGPLVTCRECKFPRSVTVMGEKGVCGMCCAPSADCCCVACTRPEGIDAEERLCANVTREDTEASRVPLVECAVRDCRAQYVMYNPARLRVWAKCFYCRHAGLRGWQDGGGAWKGALCRVQPVPRQDDLASRVPPAGIQPRDLQVSRLRVRRADGRLAGDDAAADGGGERLGVATQERGRGYPAAVQQPVHLLHGQPLRSAKHLCKGGTAPLV